jgi:hypothetical protein
VEPKTASRSSPGRRHQEDDVFEAVTGISLSSGRR